MVGPKRASHDVWSGVGSKFLSSDAVNGSEREFHKTAECPPREAPFFRSARTSCTTSGGPVRPQETQTFLCRPFRPKSAITMWAIKHCLVERGVNSCPDDLEHFYIKKKQHLAKKYPRVPVRGGICPYRHCRQQCKIFASGVNFSIFTHFLCFFPLKLLK